MDAENIVLTICDIETDAADRAPVSRFAKTTPHRLINTANDPSTRVAQRRAGKGLRRLSVMFVIAMESTHQPSRTLHAVTKNAIIALACGAGTAQASFLSGEALDSAANVLAWIVIFL